MAQDLVGRARDLEDYALCLSFLAVLVEEAQRIRALKVLDVGCGTGILGECLAVLTGAEVVGTEMSSELVAIASQRIICLHTQTGALPGTSDAFDMVYCKDVLPNVSDHASFFRQVRRLLRPGGIFVTYMPSNLDFEEKPLYKVAPDSLTRSRNRYGSVETKVAMLMSLGFAKVRTFRFLLREVPIDEAYVARHRDGYFSSTDEGALEIGRVMGLSRLQRGLEALSDHGLLLYYSWERTVLVAE